MTLPARIGLAVLLCATAYAQSQRNSTTLLAEAGNNTSAVKGTPRNGNADPRNVSKISIHTLLRPGASTRVLVRYMPWFGDEHHIGVGYRSDDAKQIARQVDDMMSRGIDGAIVDWYGPGQTFKNRSTELLLREAERHGGSFSVGISYDAGSLKECAKRGCNSTEQLISDLSYAALHFYNSPAYLRFSGRPMVTFFGLEKSEIDWERVRKQVPGNPLLVFRNSGAFALPFSDGGFSWVAPETVKAGDEEGFDYLRRFEKAAHDHPSKFAMASAYKGFDDSLAGWGKGRKIEQNCGRTWLASFKEANRLYDDGELAALIIPTWNDYEEGTAIEPGIDSCLRIEARIDGEELRWKVEGAQQNVDHFVVFASADGEHLTEVAQKMARENELHLSDLALPTGNHIFYVKAIARPSLFNAISLAVRIAVKNK